MERRRVIEREAELQEGERGNNGTQGQETNFLSSMTDHGKLVLSLPSPITGAVPVTSPPTAWPLRPTTAIAVCTTTAMSAVSQPLLDDIVAGDVVAARSGCWEDALIASGLVAVQLAGAAYMVVLTPILALGLEPLFLVTFGSLSTAIFTFPLSIKFESAPGRRAQGRNKCVHLRKHPNLCPFLLDVAMSRKEWPSEPNGWLLLQFVLLALGGVTGFQALMLHGMKKTSPAIASAMPNLAPGFIFIVAACLRFERVDLKCLYTRAKIMGTIVCLGGAITMSILQSPSSPPGHTLQGSSDDMGTSSNRDWVIGCLCLLGAVLVVSGSTVLQASTMIHFPAPFTLCSVTSLIGAVLTGMFQVITEGKLSPGTPLVGFKIILSILFVGGLVSSACVAFQTWALKKKGPVMVSMFNPMQTVGSAIFSALFLGRMVKPGSVVGMVFLFAGLYIVLWAKKKEGQVLPADRTVTDINKPLLFCD